MRTVTGAVLWKGGSQNSVNKSIKTVMYIFSIVFGAMIIYFGSFLIYHKDDYISSSYNSRLNNFTDTVVRGSILSSDGQILAKTDVSADGSETRVYPFGSLFAHSVGYTVKSKTGIEAVGNFYMMSSHEDTLSKLYNNMNDRKHTGDNVITTLNVQLQQAVYEAMGDNKGACIVMEPDTGGILAMVSKPDFDPNTLAADWNSLVSDSNNSSLLNRVTRGLYPPGSTFKVLTALEYMREYPKVYNEYNYECVGENKITDDYTVHCPGNVAHGTLDLKASMTFSCNCSFSNIGVKLNRGQFSDLCGEFLFNQTIPGSYGCADSSFTLSSDVSDSMATQTAIGQGETLITPIHNAMIFSTIANGGTMMIPYVIDRVESADGEVVKEFMPEMQGNIMTVEESETLTDMLKTVVNEGTASVLKNDSYQVAGKTGSAQYSSDIKNTTHAWFAGFAPADDPQVVICIVLEEGGSGGEIAASAAKKIFDAYFNIYG